jgi:hypothetical protein
MSNGTNGALADAVTGIQEFPDDLDILAPKKLTLVVTLIDVFSACVSFFREIPTAYPVHQWCHIRT